MYLIPISKWAEQGFVKLVYQVSLSKDTESITLDDHIEVLKQIYDDEPHDDTSMMRLKLCLISAHTKS